MDEAESRCRQGGAKGGTVTVSIQQYKDREEWLRVREHGPVGDSTGSLGGSEIPHLLALDVEGILADPWGFLALWVLHNPNARDRIYQQEDGAARLEKWRDKLRPGVNLLARRQMEPVIERAVEEALEVDILDPGDFCLVSNSEVDRIHQSPDGYVLSSGQSRPKKRVNLEKWLAAGRIDTGTEYKSVHWGAAYKWRGPEPDLYALIQAHVGMLVHELDHWIVGAVIGYGDDERDRLTYTVPRTEGIIDLIQEVAAKFWRYVDQDIEPPPDGFAAYTDTLRLLYSSRQKATGASIIMPQRVATQLEIERLKGAMEKGKRRLDQLKQEIELEMAQHEATEGIIPVDPDRGKEHPSRYVRQRVDVVEKRCECGKVLKGAYDYTLFRQVKGS